MATRISLTTIFSPPPVCSTHWTYEGSYYNSVTGGLLLQNALSQTLDSSCFPTGFHNAGRQAGTQVFSPGACPYGYTTPAIFPNSDAGTTTAICCQSKFTYFTTLTTINAGRGNTVVFAGCTSILPEDSSTLVEARDQNTALTSTIVTGPVVMWGQPITIAYAQDDITLFTTSTPSSSSVLPSSTLSAGTPSVIQPASIPSTPAMATATSTSGPAMPSAVPSKSPTDNGLSTGVKAGIGLGAAAVAISLALAVFFIWRYMRRRKPMELPVSQEELRETSFPRYPELDSRMMAQELSSKRSPQQLHSDHFEPRQKGFQKKILPQSPVEMSA